MTRVHLTARPFASIRTQRTRSRDVTHTQHTHVARFSLTEPFSRIGVPASRVPVVPRAKSRVINQINPSSFPAPCRRLSMSEDSHDVVLRPFLGVKERRRSSFAKRLLGDDLGVAFDAPSAKALRKHGATKVVFSARALKVNHRNELKRRVMVVTDVGIALMDETTRRIRRKFAWRDVREVRVSVFADDFFAIVAPDEYDALLACNRKTEAIVAMREMWKRDGKRRGRVGEGELPVSATERFTYRASATRERLVTFARADDGDVDVDVSDVVEGEEEEEENEEDEEEEEEVL